MAPVCLVELITFFPFWWLVNPVYGTIWLKPGLWNPYFGLQWGTWILFCKFLPFVLQYAEGFFIWHLSSLLTYCAEGLQEWWWWYKAQLDMVLFIVLLRACARHISTMYINTTISHSTKIFFKKRKFHHWSFKNLRKCELSLILLILSILVPFLNIFV